MGLILAIMAICAVTSTAATRAAGRQALKPWARAALIATVGIWAAVLWPPV